MQVTICDRCDDRIEGKVIQVKRKLTTDQKVKPYDKPIYDYLDLCSKCAETLPMTEECSGFIFKKIGGRVASIRYTGIYTYEKQ